MDTPLSAHKKRKVSKFIAHEMLYDYLTNRLDPDRKIAIELELKDDEENQKTLANMKKALGYIERINRVEIDQEFLAEMSESSSYISSMLKKTQFEKWPSSVKWSIEALVVLLGVIVFLVVVPWDQALKMTLLPKDKEVILAEINRDPSVGKNINLAQVEKTEIPQFQDDEKKAEPDAAPKAEPVAVALIEKDKKIETPVKKVTTPEPAEDSEKTSSDDPEKKALSTGFLYRGQLDVTNVEMNSPKITEKIIELGGRKAGEVDIGWKKSDTTYYYHFTFPEAKYEELVEFLSEYATTELKKEKHPRIMPDGIIRLIITVDEKKQ